MVINGYFYCYSNWYICWHLSCRIQNKQICLYYSILNRPITRRTSIVVGVVAFIWVVIPLKSYSALQGSAALTVMMLPLIIRSTEETMKMIPNTMKAGWISTRDILPNCHFARMLPSAFGVYLLAFCLLYHVLLAETAPLMLTALGSDDTMGRNDQIQRYLY